MEVVEKGFRRYGLGRKDDMLPLFTNGLVKGNQR